MKYFTLQISIVHNFYNNVYNYITQHFLQESKRANARNDCKNNNARLAIDNLLAPPCVR